ncbi:hypothetical protein [Alkalicoccobacillus porphyridii]|uniref:Uncharacterized protein n=1 Tax=Alkalicoccobacillus porphyridii TaxID=2597270 RepID=A0A553ZWE7_9BACI|nr:hypothetical protein [Alkalicoccobacillus porphyridii]TSB45800.1 hypothetical protein FN960_15070 [Alkalicoccobacillus porphyridii]
MEQQQAAYAQQMKEMCEQYTNQAVTMQANGMNYEGVIESVDDNHVYLMVPVDEQGQLMSMYEVMAGMNQGNEQMMSQGQSRYGYPYQPYYPGYYPYYPRPRPYGWRRFFFPLVALTALAVL